MATLSQLGAVLGRDVPDYKEQMLRAKASGIGSLYAAKDAADYQAESYALQQEALKQQQANAWESLKLQSEEQDEAKKQAKQSELMGWANTGVTTALGLGKYGGSALNALGFGSDAAATSMYQAPSGILSGAIDGTEAAGALSGSMYQAPSGILGGSESLGMQEATNALSGAGGTTATAADAAGASGFGWGNAGAASLGSTIATSIGGGKSTATQMAKGALGGALGSGAFTSGSALLAGAALAPETLGLSLLGGAAVGAVTPVVTQVVSSIVGGGRVICTKLTEMGLLDPALHKSEAAWSLAHKAKATVRGYHWWAVPFTRFMDGKPRFCKAVAVVVKPYAKFLAFKAGSPLGKFNLFGAALDLAGSAACWCIGQFVKFDKYGSEWDREDAHREEVDADA